ncbi:hypothetical protein [Campylobacter sp.]|uniref:hypothetical protein n=1 Tax=Campylobacter sp. TaxID=205 RepID=UPI002AA80427|nr:hypothetical protein [Campylobacter sp.]
MRLSVRWLSSYFLGCDFSLVAFVKNERTSKKFTLKFARNSSFYCRNSYNLEFLDLCLGILDFS